VTGHYLDWSGIPQGRVKAPLIIQTPCGTKFLAISFPPIALGSENSLQSTLFDWWRSSHTDSPVADSQREMRVQCVETFVGREQGVLPPRRPR
jgi:hypothetical protein